ncbi:endonuclease/exonuclease/phosphatase [Microdochium trichocladiopsis]|uniref:Endonuclease/exonuclease/phosphatase n=1 Tax=Microdochium trichocladiopsis TaxID=1682393 RepID=A0A9P8Y200_9PEZI|nr:endonuclease/exonuclease/phosphatase [Microdochium trichocladiopsis]KAH7028979.1 endonuclease/exonuclease/phosphatase [Microdochium trichocladiopsis]
MQLHRLAAGTASVAAAVVSAQKTAGDLSVLTMNVAGLPAILQGNDVPGDKTTNSRLIGSLFAQYDFDIINMQEDFNYHASIYETDDHPFRTATSGGVPFGSGLNTVSNYDWVEFNRVKWATCSNSESNDCLTPKGFTFMRVALDTSPTTSVYVDVYNLHADAGTSDADLVARSANIRQVADYAATWSVGNAVIIFGDTNSRYSRPLDVAVRELIASGFKDAWVEFERGGVVPTAETLCSNPSTTDACETVDKVFYRSSPLVTLTGEGFKYASSRFLQPDGNILSDHNPVNVNFTWAAGASLRQSGLRGGPHGDWFNDAPALAAKTTKPKASVLTFRGDSRLDSVSIQLADGTVLSHGGSGGTASSLTLGAAEYWTAATLCQAQRNGHTRNFYISATTSTGRTLKSGTTTGDCGTFTAPAGWQIVGFLGRDGDEMDQLGFIYSPQ